MAGRTGALRGDVPARPPARSQAAISAPDSGMNTPPIR